ncbi:MAG: glycosyltransferase family 2 protein [Patescibacteria group bacterium]
MKEKTFDSPVLFIIFNRPNATNLVFAEIKKIKPQKLFIAADGPRKDVPEDYKKCAQTREIIKKIDWPCEVKTLFHKENLGCGLGPLTAINWFFENVEEGIILEDDCVPDQSFFYFCQELLEYYRNNKKIMHISGDNFQYGKKRGFSSYYFSEYAHGWGWATWRRAWKYNNIELLNPELRRHIWDKQWYLSIRKRGGLAILPNVNLVSNIGIGGDSTHTKEPIHYANLPAKQIVFPLIHPKIILRHRLADFFTNRDMFKGSFKRLVFQKILNITPKSMEFIIKGFVKIIKKNET